MNKPGMKDGVLQIGASDPHHVYKSVEREGNINFNSLPNECPIRKTICNNSCAWYDDGKCAIITGKVTEGKQCPFTSRNCKFDTDKQHNENFRCKWAMKKGCYFIAMLNYERGANQNDK